MILEIISKKYGIKEFEIDDEDYAKIKNYTWHINYNKNANSFYVKTNKNIGKNKRTAVLLHRLLMNFPVGMVIDHKNGNTLDNRKENLRTCSIRENSCNCKKYKNGKLSKYKGVSYDKNINKYKAYIRFKGKYIHLGYFSTDIDASEAYDAASIKYHKNFSKTNKEII